MEFSQRIPACITSCRLNAERRKKKQDEFILWGKSKLLKIQLTFWHLNIMHNIKFSWQRRWLWNLETMDQLLHTDHRARFSLSLSLSLKLMLIIKHVLRKLGAKNGGKPRGELELSCHIMLFKGLAGRCYENRLNTLLLVVRALWTQYIICLVSQKSGKYKWKTFYYGGGGSTSFLFTYCQHTLSLFLSQQRLLLMTPPISQLMWVSTWYDMIQMHLYASCNSILFGRHC